MRCKLAHSADEKVLIRSVYAADESPQVSGQHDHRNRQRFQPQPRERPRRIGLFSRPKMKEPNQPDQEPRHTSENQMQKEDSLKLLPFELELPSQESSRNHGRRTDGGTEKIVVGHNREASALGVLRQKVKNYTSNEQRDGKVNQRHVLRVFREQNRFWIEWIHVGFSKESGRQFVTTTLPVILGWMEQK